MRALEDLKFCAIPALSETWSIAPSIRLQINIFAGQLYIKSYNDYIMLCEFLGLCSKYQNDNVDVAPDGFVSPASRALSTIPKGCPFKTSPVPFVSKIMLLRRKGQGINVSHLGRILNGELLLEKDF
jgi:hypothetical protein